jgi:hypothetical protein
MPTNITAITANIRPRNIEIRDSFVAQSLAGNTKCLTRASIGVTFMSTRSVNAVNEVSAVSTEIVRARPHNTTTSKSNYSQKAKNLTHDA